MRICVCRSVLSCFIYVTNMNQVTFVSHVIHHLLREVGGSYHHPTSKIYSPKQVIPKNIPGKHQPCLQSVESKCSAKCIYKSFQIIEPGTIPRISYSLLERKCPSLKKHDNTFKVKRMNHDRKTQHARKKEIPGIQVT